MLYVSDIKGDIVYITNSETNEISMIWNVYVLFLREIM